MRSRTENRAREWLVAPLRTAAWAPILLAAVAALAGCPDPAGRSAEEPIRLSGQAFGTTWSIVFVPSPGEKAPSAGEIEEAAAAALGRVDALMSTFREDSELVRFNRSEGLGPFLFSPESQKVIRAAIWYARDTGGAFDPTVGPLVRAWGFGAAAAERPEPEAIEAARELVGWHLLYFDEEGRLRRRVPGVELDLSGIAKGHGVDAVVQGLSPMRPAGLMVEIGGDLRVLGTRPGGQPWRLGIQSPGGGLHSTVALTSGALATSGDYRQRRGEGDGRRTHIVDPRSGEPASPRVASVSVMAPSALEADAVATALVVLGASEAMAYVEARPWIEALVMTREAGSGEVSEVEVSSGWPGS